MHGDGFLDDPDSKWSRNHQVARHLDTLIGQNCLVLSGEPGLGKSVALEQAFPNIDYAGGGDATTIWIRFRDVPDSSVFTRRVFDSARWKSWLAGDHTISLVLDGLDEGLIKIKDFLSFLTSELRSSPLDRLRVVVACRTADWPTAAGYKLLSLWNSDTTRSFWELCPLRRKDAELAAASKQISPNDFLEQVYEKKVVTLASRPTTLFFLLRQFKDSGQLEGTHREIYERGIRDLCDEPNPERAEQGRSASPGRSVFKVDQLRDGAAYLAAMLILSGRSAISLGDPDSASANGDLHLASLLQGTDVPSSCSLELLHASLGTALFSSRGEQRFGFTHQTFAECLAARQIRKLPLIQLRELFCRVDGQQEHVIPQLAETAAWLAGANDNFLQHLLRIDPEVLLRSDITRIQGTRKHEVVEAVLEKAKRLELFDDIGLRRFFSSLNHDGLGEQLWSYINDSSLNIIVRRLALEIAEECRITDLNNELLAILHNPDVDQQVKDGAARILKKTLRDDELNVLEPLVRGECGPDPDDQLKAYALERLVPTQWSVAHASQWMQWPKNDHFHGGYWMFLHHHAPDSVTVEDLPELLQFLHPIGQCFDTLNPFCKLAHKVICLALSNLQVEAIREGAIRLWREKRRRFEHPRGGDEANDLVELWSNDAIRREFASAVLLHQGTTDEDVSHLLFDVFPLLEPRDLEWVLEQLPAAPAERLPLWIHCVRDLAYPDNVAKCWDRFLQALEDIPELRAQFAWFRAWQLNEPEARKAKARYLWDERRRRRFRKKRKLPDISDLVDKELAKIANGDSWRWQNLAWYLSLAEGQALYPAFPHHDVTERHGWQKSDANQRTAITNAAREFLLRHSDGYEVLGHRTNFSDPGYAAIHLLRDEMEQDNDLRTAVGSKWVDAVVGRFHNGEDYHQQLVALVHALNPDKAVDGLLREAEENYQRHGHIFAWRAFARCWNNRLSAMLGAFVLSHVTNRETVISSLCFLLEKDPLAFNAWMLRVLPRVQRFTEEARVTVLAVAFALAPEQTWDLVWPQITGDEKLAKKVMLSVASNLEFEARKHPLRLSAEQYGMLADLLYSLFPPDAEVERLHGIVTPRQAVADYRRKVSDALTASSDPAAGEALLRLAAKFSNEKIVFMWRYRDHLNTRRRTHWKPPSPSELNKILLRSETRFLSTDADLFDVVLESLHRFEAYYTRQELPAFERLWRWSKKGNKRIDFRPKDEEDLSDELARWFRDDLQSRGVVVGREVQIERRQKTDVWLKAVAGNEGGPADTLTVVVEVKGCWNSRVCDDIEDQLVRKYLLPHGLKFGLYVVGWFVCQDWKFPRNNLKSTTLEDARTEFQELDKVTESRHPELAITGLLLDCRYR
jgi:hypothetical protein